MTLSKQICFSDTQQMQERMAWQQQFYKTSAWAQMPMKTNLLLNAGFAC